jgi:hypothetical protein
MWMRQSIAEQWAFSEFASLRPCGIVEVAHVGGRGLSQKCPDKESMPLGRFHHQHATTFGGGPESHHSLGRRFWRFHGIDKVRTLELLWKLYQEETGRLLE